ncbi:MAG: hypothetical protein A2792_13835 [Sphingomonadales bacterium RIFCSPHIGHO2_01_FULL_65_20]|uniref:DUF1491 family protein n=1 Tax=unclassified Blastomonas TaxID=2626550 RepID=UPI0008373621|nr:DUF1491 family protein [Blastomonas sp.]OHC93262.1 MAG: hypothetical protein A2792_13835 [Sphingomonadales bacterium RIFCSPHIGHO2_01_FULL_65_20]
MIEPRLATHVRIEALKRLTAASGGFATIIAKGDPVSGAILIARTVRGQDNALFELFRGLDGQAEWQEVWSDDSGSLARKGSMAEYVERRRLRDADLWIIELDVASRAQFNAIMGQTS